MKYIAKAKWLLIFTLFGLLFACSDNGNAIGDEVHLSGPTMGTSYNIKYVSGADQPNVEEVQERVTQILEKVNDQMSTYRLNSELSQFNQHQSSEPFTVSKETAAVVTEAIRLNNITEGALDVTVGPLVNLWGFGPNAKPETVPTNEQIAQARQSTGIANLHVIGNRLQKSIPDLYVDLSSIAKGHGTDRLADYLDSVHIHNYMVEVGGEIRAQGKNKNGISWRIAIERPSSAQRSVELVINLNDMAIATSGDYRNYYEEDGKRYSHIIDPATANPIDNKVASVTVLDQKSMTADGLATAFMVLGLEKGLKIANEQGYPVLFIVKTNNGFKDVASDAFKPYLSNSVSAATAN